MTEEEKQSKRPGPFNAKRYAQGMRHACEDHESGDTIEDMQKFADTHLSGRTWYAIGYQTAINGIKEGQAI